MGWRKDLQWSISYHENLKKKREAQRKISEWYKAQREKQVTQSLVHKLFKIQLMKNVRVF